MTIMKANENNTDTKRLTVDRIEGDFAVLENEDGKTAAVKLFLLPDVSEGDVLEISQNRSEAEARKAAANERVNRLWKD